MTGQTKRVRAAKKKSSAKSRKHRKKEAEEEEKEEPVTEGKSIMYVLIGIGVFVAIIILIFMFSGKSSQTIDTPDEMFMSVVNNGDSDYGYMYRGYAFINYQGSWMTRIRSFATGELYDIPMHFGPKDVGDVTIEGNPLPWIVRTSNRTQTYVTFNPLSDEFQYLALANTELSISLIQVIGVIPVVGCITNESDACRDVPVITCNNTDQQVIYIIDNEGPAKITKKKNCIILEGKDLELLRAVDRFLYTWYGIMPAGPIAAS
ncbi:MAG: hypothetical protein GXP63_06395 [DPANN group archaeon]|nr:hypothetical protein [DPANN group archaeon]